MDILGFSLNLVSFLTITLSTGILVDDAIVEIENIVRHMRMGKSPLSRGTGGCRRNRPRRDHDQLTIIAIFAPAELHVGIAGSLQAVRHHRSCRCFSRYSRRGLSPRCWRLTFSRITPMRIGRRTVLQTYTRLVTWSVGIISLRTVLIVSAFSPRRSGASLCTAGFLPAQDSARSLLAMELPPGSQLAFRKDHEEIVARCASGRGQSVFVDADGCRRENVRESPRGADHH